MKFSMLTRAFTFFIAAQFLNVQIQTAYGTEAVTQANPEVAQALKQMEAKIQSKIEGRSERAQLKYAYRLYKIDVKLRNRTFNKTDEEIQQRIEALDQGKVTAQTETLNDEDQELAQTLNSDEVLNDLAGAQHVKISFNKSQVKKEQLLKNSDPLLLDLGSEVNDNGTFSKASFNTFQNKVFEMGKSLDSRAPASMNVIVKIILSLLIVAAGLAILYFVLVVYALTVAFGGTISSGGAMLLIFLTVGSVVGMIFGLKAVLSAQNEINGVAKASA